MLVGVLLFVLLLLSGDFCVGVVGTAIAGDLVVPTTVSDEGGLDFCSDSPIQDPIRIRVSSTAASSSFFGVADGFAVFDRTLGRICFLVSAIFFV